MPSRRPQREQRQRRRIRGNLVAPQLDQLLADPGSRQRLVAKLNLLSGTPGYEDLEGFAASHLSWLGEKYETACADKLVVALCWALGEVLGRGPLDIYFLLGMRSDPSPPSDVTWPFTVTVADRQSTPAADDEEKK